MTWVTVMISKPCGDGYCALCRSEWMCECECHGGPVTDLEVRTEILILIGTLIVLAIVAYLVTK